ncbi:MAG: energy-coupling factor transporter transmembrane component T [Actinomycetes bacterium]
MSLAAAATPRIDADHWFTRTNPLARVIAGVVLSLPNLLGLDTATAVATVSVALALLPVTGLPRPVVVRTLTMLTVVAASAALANALAGAESWQVAGSAGLRVLALLLPGVLAFLTIDPIDLADSLVHQLRVPVRVAYGTLAAVRLTPLLAQEWQVLGRAERARGLGGRWWALPRRWSRRTVALLVAAVRRATRVAVALDARGFDSAASTTAAESRWSGVDSALVVGSGLAAVFVDTAGRWFG